jgi:hypothetical protein
LFTVDDELVMAGQGTLGLEILDDLPEVTDIVCEHRWRRLDDRCCIRSKARKA